MTASIKGALLVLHCVPYHFFQQSPGLCSKRRGTSTAVSDSVKGSLSGRAGCDGNDPPATHPLFLPFVHSGILCPYSMICRSQYSFTVWDPQTHYKYKGLSKSQSLSSFLLVWCGLRSLVFILGELHFRFLGFFSFNLFSDANIIIWRCHKTQRSLPKVVGGKPKRDIDKLRKGSSDTASRVGHRGLFFITRNTA